AKSGGIFIKLDLRAADNKGWRIREAIYIERRTIMSVKNEKLHQLFENNREDCPSGSLQIKNLFI
ncbi:hypothetical protein AALA36_14980, partial [Lachnospiraceae bacterium 66-29]